MGPLARAGLVAGSASLLLFFCVLRFPYEQFREPVEAQLARATGAQVSVGALSGGPSLGVVGVRAEPLRLAWPDGRSVALDRATLRPAWSFSWLRGSPALHVDLRAPAGRVVGTAWPSPGARGFDGRVEDLALEALASLAAGAGDLGLQGRVDGDVELSLGPEGPTGVVSLHARSGSLAPPGSPMAIPYETLRADARLQPGGGVEIERLSLDGPMLAASLHGTVGPSRSLAEAPLDLELRVEHIEAALQPIARGLGLEASAPDAPLRVSGTLGNPRVR